MPAVIGYEGQYLRYSQSCLIEDGSKAIVECMSLDTQTTDPNNCQSYCTLYESMADVSVSIAEVENS